MPAKPGRIERLRKMTFCAWSTSRIGMPESGVPGSRAAGLTTSFAPMTSTTSGDGVDAVDEFDVALGEQVGELAHRVLRLRDREAVTRHHDHLLRVVEQD